MKSTSVRLTVAAVLLLPGAVFLAPAWSAPLACGVYANTPQQSGRTQVVGTGGRTGCTNTVSMIVKLKYDQFGPDGQVNSSGGRIVNDVFSVFGCAGQKSYYTNTSTDSGQIAGSNNRTLSC